MSGRIYIQQIVAACILGAVLSVPKLYAVSQSSNLDVVSRVFFKAPNGLVASGDTVYIASGASAIAIDVTDPSSPTTLFTSYPLSYLNDIALGKNYIYGAALSDGVEIISLKTPSLSDSVYLYSVKANIVKVEMNTAKTFLFAVSSDSGVYVLQVSDNTLSQAAHIQGNFGAANALAFYNDTLFVGTDSGVYVYDISVYTSPSLVYSIHTRFPVDNIVRSDSLRAYTKSRVINWHKYSFVSVNSNTQALSIATDTGSIADIAAYNNKLFILYSDGTLEMYKIVQNSMDFDTQIKLSGMAYEIYADSSKLYAGLDGDGVVELSYSDTSITKLGQTKNIESSHGVDVTGHILSVATGNTGIRLVDISDSSRPVYLSNISSNMYPYKVLFDDTLLISAELYGGIALYNVSDPSNPTFISYTNINGNALDIAFSGSVIYIANSYYGLTGIDFSNPSNPEILWNINTGHATSFVYVNGAILIVSDMHQGTYIYDISTPASPSLKSELEASTSAATDDTLLFLSKATGQCDVFDISDLQNPSYSYSFNLPKSAVSMKVLDGYLYAACQDSGAFIYNYSQTSSTLSAHIGTGEVVEDMVPLNIKTFVMSIVPEGVYIVNSSLVKNACSDDRHNSMVPFILKSNIVKDGIVISNITAPLPLDISLYDAAGRKVFEKVYLKQAASHSINLGHLNAGVYNLVLASQGERWTRKILILNR